MLALYRAISAVVSLAPCLLGLYNQSFLFFPYFSYLSYSFFFSDPSYLTFFVLYVDRSFLLFALLLLSFVYLPFLSYPFLLCFVLTLFFVLSGWFLLPVELHFIFSQSKFFPSLSYAIPLCHTCLLFVELFFAYVVIFFGLCGPFLSVLFFCVHFFLLVSYFLVSVVLFTSMWYFPIVLCPTFFAPPCRIFFPSYVLFSLPSVTTFSSLPRPQAPSQRGKQGERDDVGMTQNPKAAMHPSHNYTCSALEQRGTPRGEAVFVLCRTSQFCLCWNFLCFCGAFFVLFRTFCSLSVLFGPLRSF